MIDDSIATEFFHGMHSAGINYAHFKSSFRLADSFAGKTDFDLLIREQDADRCASIALSHGFVARGSSRFSSKSRTIDMIGYDEGMDAVFHLSFHNPLVFGYRNLKNHRLEDVDRLLSESALSQHFPIYVLPPAFEGMLLILRACLKSPAVQRWTRSIFRWDHNNTWLPEPPMQSEMESILARVSDESIAQASDDFVPKATPVVRAFLGRFRSGRLGPVHLLVYRIRMQLLLRDHASLPWLRYLCRRLSQFVANKKLRRSLNRAVVIGVVGADGSGKSTLVDELHRWLSYKISCETIYMGQAKNNPVRKGINTAVIVAGRVGMPSLKSYCTAGLALYDSRRRLRLGMKARRLADKGIVVISDRWPMLEFESMDCPMDGPRIGPGVPGFHRERSHYRRVYPIPDAIIALDVDTSTALARHRMAGRPAPNAETIARKTAAVRSLNARGPRLVWRFEASRHQKDRDALPLLFSKRRIWNLIAETPCGEEAAS